MNVCLKLSNISSNRKEVFLESREVKKNQFMIRRICSQIFRENRLDLSIVRMILLREILVEEEIVTASRGVCK